VGEPASEVTLEWDTPGTLLAHGNPGTKGAPLRLCYGGVHLSGEQCGRGQNGRILLSAGHH
jgi:hypothetical protein